MNIPIKTLSIVTGPNGSGKSTLLKILGGVWRSTKGRVSVLNQNPTSKNAKKLIGIVFHENTLYEEMTVRENLRFYAYFYDVDWELSDVVEILELRKVMEKKVQELSFGWRRRANIAKAAIHNPKVLLLDEPLAGLDEAGKDSVLSLIDYIFSSGGTVVAASPFPSKELIKHFAHLIFRLHNGRLEKVEGS